MTNLKISASKYALIQDKRLGNQIRLCKLHIRIPAIVPLATHLLPGSEKIASNMDGAGGRRASGKDPVKEDEPFRMTRKFV